jgi:signal transduction histidine kinase
MFKVSTSLKNKLTWVVSLILGSMFLLIVSYLYLDVKTRIESENYRAGLLIGSMVRSLITSDPSVNRKILEGIPAEKWDDIWNNIRTSIMMKLPIRKWCIFKSNQTFLACSELVEMEILNLTKEPVFREYMTKGEPQPYRDYFIYSIPLHNNSLTIVFKMPEGIQKSIRMPQRAFYLTLFVLIICFFSIFIAIRYFFINNILKPINSIIEASFKIRNKDFNITLTSKENKDEIDKLIDAFREMADNLKRHNELLEQKIAEITQKFEEINKELILSQRLTTTGIMVSGIAHEINNPLGAIINAAYSLRKKDAVDEKTYEEYIKLIIDGLFRIKDIVRRVLQFSPRYQKNIKSPESLSAILDDALTLSRYRATKRGIKIENSITPQNDFKILCNKAEMQQVFLNLIINAMDAMEERGSLLKIYAEKLEDGFVKVYVEDDGVGMDEETMKNIFNPFFTTKQPGKGTGLGLYIVHYVVSQHNGTISVESTKGAGTKFILTLPQA